jgi:hypothetical protein
MRKFVLIIAVLTLSALLHAIAGSAGDESHPWSEKRSFSRIEKAAVEVNPGLNLQPCQELLEDDVIISSLDDVYKFQQNSSYWAVVGLRPDPGSDWDLSLYSDSCGEGTEFSYSWSWEDSTEFVVADYNHSPTGWEGIWVGRWAGTGDVRVEYENDADVLFPGPNTGLDWPAGDVVEIWDVDLEAGSYPTLLNITSGNADLGIAIFESNGSAYYAGRWEAAAASDAAGAGGDEYFEYVAPRTDRYAIVVWANNDNSATFDIGIGVMGIGDGNGVGTDLPAAFALSQNHPNPFNPSTVISYQLPERAEIRLNVYDIRGRLVQELVNGFVEAGAHSVQWDGKNTLGQGVPSGVYFYILDTDRGYRTTRKMAILK